MRKKFLFIVISVAFAAFAARILVCADLYFHDSDVINPVSQSDMFTYNKLAKEILNGGHKGVYYYQPFYYAAFLPVIFFCSGSSIWGVIAVQSLLGALTVYISALIGARIFGKRAGITAALLLAFCNVLVIYTPYMLIATLQAFWIVLVFYLTLNAIKYRKLRWWILLGTVTALSILTRGNVWFFVPGLLFAALYLEFAPKSFKDAQPKKSILKKLAPAALLLIFIFLPQLPFSWHNTKELGKLTGPSTAAQVVLALGNTPETSPGALEYPPAFQAWMNDTKKGISVYSKIWDWFEREPLAYIELTFRKMLLFWDSREIGYNVVLTHHGAKSKLLPILGFIPNSVIISLAIAGMFMFGSRILRSRKICLLYYFVAAFWMATAAFYILSRFRAPLVPLLGVFAGGYLAACFSIIRKKDFGALLKRCLPFLIFGLFICYIAYDVYSKNYEPILMRIARPNGIIVDISNKETMVLDNGPRPFGGWVVGKFKPHEVLEKEFAGIDFKAYKTADFELTTYWEKSGKAEIEINGSKKLIIQNTIGLNTIKLKIPFPKDGIVKIILLKTDGELYYILDSQRDYGRTLVNGKKVFSELVCRMYCFK